MFKWQHERNRVELTIWHMIIQIIIHMIMFEFFNNFRWHDFYEKLTAMLQQ